MKITINTNHGGGNCNVSNAANDGAIKEVEEYVRQKLESMGIEEDVSVRFNISVSQIDIECSNDKLRRQIKNMFPC